MSEGLGDWLEATLDLGPGDVLERFAGGLEPEWIEEALVATGKASCRHRKLAAERVFWLVVGMALYADRSIRDVVEHLSLVVPGVKTLAPSAIPAARYRLGEEPVRWVFEHSAKTWGAVTAAAEWHGLELLGIDGTCLRVPDSDANLEAFGKPGGRNGSGDAGYPQVRLACLMNLRTRLLTAASFGAYASSEHELAAELRPHIPDHSLTILDRGFINYRAFAALITEGEQRHFLVRLRSNSRVRELEELPDGSMLAELPRDRSLKRIDPALPEAIRGRVVAYQLPGGQPCRLFTTLTDHELSPAEELVELYHERWELEVGYDERKTHLLERKEALLRSKKPEGIRQELWGALLLYNLVRNEMLGVAEEREVPAQRISFESSLLMMRNFWEVVAWRSRPGNVPKYLKDFRSTLDILVLPPRRGARRFPRHVKIKMSNYARNRGRRSGQE